MSISKDIAGKELQKLIDREKKDLKQGRVYFILEQGEDKNEFSMLCLDTVGNKGEEPTASQIIAAGVVNIVENSAEAIFELGEEIMLEKKYTGSNIISLDSYRDKGHNNIIFRPEKNDKMTVTLTFDDKDGDDDGR